MNKIGFQSFRRFVSFQSIDIQPITFFVGGNNSGKSTVVKGALLMANFLKTRMSNISKQSIINIRPSFSFDVVTPYDVHINTFKRAKNEDCNNGCISFSLGIDEFLFNVEVFNDKENDDVTKVPVKIFSIIDQKNNVIFNIDYSISRMTVEFCGIYVEPGIKLPVNLRSHDELMNLIENSTDFAEITALKDELEKAEMYVKHIELESMSSNKKIDLPLSVFEDNLSEFYATNVVRNFIEYSNTSTSNKLNQESEEYKKELENKKFLQWKNNDLVQIMNRINNILSTKSIEYIYAHAAKQVTFYNSKDKNDYMADTIHQYESEYVNTYEKSKTFLGKWIYQFGIGQRFEIIAHGGEAYELIVYKDAYDFKGKPLADKGMGSIQMMILLLKLATYIKVYKGHIVSPTIMIEEPEQNLHPAYQSKLAEMFYELSSDPELNFKFVVETHSEYIIRKTQVLVAEGINKNALSLESNPFEVYYFPEHDDVRKMEYKENGRFTKKFDKGFFDEAGQWNLELTRLERGV